MARYHTEEKCTTASHRDLYLNHYFFYSTLQTSMTTLTTIASDRINTLTTFSFRRHARLLRHSSSWWEARRFVVSMTSTRGCARIVTSHPSKTEFMWCATSRRLHHIENAPINIYGTNITPSTTVRNLGVTMNNDFSMKSHIVKLWRSCFCSIRHVRGIRRSLTREAAKTLIAASYVPE